MRIHRERRVTAVVPTASMADIAFLLIIFFMLTTSFSPVKTSVDLPESVERAEVEQNAAIVAITTQSEIVFSDGDNPGFNVNSPDELGPHIQSLVRAIPNKQFVIKADRAVRYQSVDAVLDQLRRNGAKNIGLLTEQKRGPAGS
ncbi:MAG: biopolymer transporter ExbD [Acidobacteria bacterium]|nr:MAG: biopolymer transporter ExbD [Acidobacteriota bacterium]